MPVFVNLTRDHWLGLLVAGWIVVSVLSLILLVQNDLQVFDVHQRIAQRYDTVPDYLTELSQTFNTYQSGSAASVLRVVQDGCRCNLGSTGHWRQLQKENPNTSFRELSLSELSDDAQSLVPATPMAIYFNEGGQVIYAGPFSDSIYCRSSNSLIEAYIEKNVTMLFAPLSTKGCFCGS